MLFSLLIGCAGTSAETALSTQCDARTEQNHGRPFGRAETKDPPQTQVVIRPTELSINNRAVTPGPSGIEMSPETRVLFRSALAENRRQLIGYCAHGASPFDHTIILMATADAPFAVVLAVLEDARAERYEDVRLVLLLN